MQTNIIIFDMVNDWLQDIAAEVDPNSIGSFKFPNFLAMMTRKLDENSAEDEIREAFTVFDNVSPALLA